MKKITLLLLLFVTSCTEFVDVFNEGPQHAASPGRYYKIKEGDSLGSIARKFRISVQQLAELNDVMGEENFIVGKTLYIPKKVRVAKTSEPVTQGSIAKADPDEVEKIQFERSRFEWPVEGVVTSPFGVRKKRQHDGIDISAKRGTPVKSSADGKVVYTGTMKGYGRLVVIKHDSQYFTAYAHLQDYSVKKGDKVKQGQRIGSVGNSGRSSGPHCHFEIRQNMEPRNPLFFLPKK